MRTKIYTNNQMEQTYILSKSRLTVFLFYLLLRLIASFISKKQANKKNLRITVFKLL